MTTTIRKALEPNSSISTKVRDGIKAVERRHKNRISADIRADFDDSIDIDAAFQPTYPQSSRWDYLLGHKSSKKIVGLEPHSANEGEVSVVIAKRKESLDHLKGHLKVGHKVSAWYWVTSGKVDFIDHDKATTRLKNAGITFVNKQLLKKHL